MEDNDKKHFEKRVRETTYLIQAVTMGDKFMVKKLLNGEYLKQFGKWSGDVNAQNKKGETPLTIATQNDFTEIVKILSKAIKLEEEAENRLSFATSGLSPESPVNYLDDDTYNKVGLLLEEKGSKRKRSRKRSKKVESKKRKKKKKTRKRRKTRKK